MTVPVPESPMWPVQQALRAVLAADPTLSTLVTGVYDYVLENDAYPYIVIGDATEISDNSHDRFGWQTVFTLHVWTEAEGHKQGLTIGQRITALLDHQPLTIPGYDHVVTRAEFSQTLTDPEPPGSIRHLVLRYRVVTEQPA